MASEFGGRHNVTSAGSKHRRHDTLNPHFPADIPFTSLERCIARYPYQPDTSAPTDSPKLRFQKGDIIVILSKDVSGWWNGMLFPPHGEGVDAAALFKKQVGAIDRAPETGWFPATYVDPWTPERAAVEKPRSTDAVAQTTELATSPHQSDVPSTSSSGAYADELAGLRQSLSDLKLLDIKAPPTINTKNLRGRKASLGSIDLPSPYHRRGSRASSLRSPLQSAPMTDATASTSPLMSALVTSATGAELVMAATSPAWDALVEAVVQAVSQLNLDAKANRKNKFVEHAVIVSINIRYLLKTSGCLDKGSPTLQRSRTLRHAHADLFRALTNLVKHARSAAEPFVSADIIAQLRVSAAHLLSATRAFVQAALQRDVVLTPLDSAQELKEIADMMGLSATIVFKDGRFQGVHTSDTDVVYIERLGSYSDLVQQATTAFLDAVATEQRPDQLNDVIQSQGQHLTHVVGQLLAYLEEQQAFSDSPTGASGVATSLGEATKHHSASSLQSPSFSAEGKYMAAKQALEIALSDMVVATSAAIHPYQSAFSHQQIFVVAAMLVEAVRELILAAKNCRTQRMRQTMSPRSPLGATTPKTTQHSRAASEDALFASPTLQTRHRRSNSAHDILTPEPSQASPSSRPARSRLASIKIDTSVAQAPILKDKTLPLIPTPLVSAYPDGLKTDDSMDRSPATQVATPPAAVVVPVGPMPPAVSEPELGPRRPSLSQSASRESLNTLLRGDDHSERWYMRVHRNPQDIVFSNDSDAHIKAGTLKAIIDELTSHAPSMHQQQEQSENEFQWQFLETFRAFSTPAELLSLLTARFHLPQPAKLTPHQAQDWQESFQRVVQARVSIILKQWITHHYHVRTDADVLPAMKAFIDQDLAAVFAKDAQIIDELLSLRMSQRNQRPSLEQPPLPKLIPFSIDTVPKNFNILDYDPSVIARQLTIIDSFAFLSIERGEWLEYKPNTKARRKSVIGSLTEEADNDHSNIRRMIQHSNLLTGWVAKTILNESDMKKRGAVIKHFIKVAQQCHQMNNFASRESILAALNSSPIYRLKRTFEYMSTKTKNTLAMLAKHMDRDTNRKAYRDALKNVDGACVPFLGLFLTDLTFTMDGNPTLVYSDRLINFDKFAKIAAILENIYKLQAVMYPPMSTPPELYAGIQYGLENAPDADTLFERSMEVEPREREDEKILRLLQENGFG